MVYKVVRPHVGRWHKDAKADTYQSPGIVPTRLENRWLCLNYAIGMTTRPTMPGTLLFAFDTLENARGFVGGPESGWLIFESDAEGVRYPKGNELFIKTDEMTALGWWEHGGAKYGEGFLMPDGTVFCGSIILRRRVQ